METLTLFKPQARFSLRRLVKIQGTFHRLKTHTPTIAMNTLLQSEEVTIVQKKE